MSVYDLKTWEFSSILRHVRLDWLIRIEYGFVSSDFNV